MIGTLMALWNRGVHGRLVVIGITFCCICISISLLFVTAGSVWGSLLTHGHPGNKVAHVVSSTMITATAPTAGSTPAIVATPTMAPTPCVASATVNSASSTRSDATAGGEQTGIPTRKAATPPAHRRKKPTPTPGITPTPKPRPSPTSPAPTPTTFPSPTLTSTVEATPTVTTVPTLTPTVTSTVASTPTSAPTSTSTPGNTPTATTATVTITPTVTVPAGSPTVLPTATDGMRATRTTGDGFILSGTPSSADTNQAGRNCLGDSLAQDGVGTMLSQLQNFLWLIAGSSLLGTALFCTQLYRMTRKRA